MLGADSLFIIIWLELPIIWHYMLKAAGLQIRRISISTVTLLFFYLFQYVGLPIYYFNLDKYRLIEPNKYITLKVFAATSLTITLLILGFIAAKNHIGKLNYRLYFNKINTKLINNKRLLLINLIALFCVSIFILYIHKIGIENIALIQLTSIADNGLGANVSRSLMSDEFEGKLHWYSLFMHKILSFVVLILFADSFNKKAIKSKLSFIVFLFFVSLALLSAVEKLPFIDLLCSLAFLYLIINSNGLIKISKMITYTGAAILACSLLVTTFSGFENIQGVTSATISRITTGGIEPAYIYMETYPNKYDYLFGKSLPNPGGLLPYEPARSSFAVGEDLNTNTEVTTSAPTAFWADAYANFGWIGILVVPFFVGYLIYLIDRLFLIGAPNAISLSVYVWAITHYKNLAVTSIGGYIFDINLIIILFVSILIYGSIPNPKN